MLLDLTTQHRQQGIRLLPKIRYIGSANHASRKRDDRGREGQKNHNAQTQTQGSRIFRTVNSLDGLRIHGPTDSNHQAVTHPLTDSIPRGRPNRLGCSLRNRPCRLTKSAKLLEHHHQQCDKPNQQNAPLNRIRPRHGAKASQCFVNDDDSCKEDDARNKRVLAVWKESLHRFAHRHHLSQQKVTDCKHHHD